MSVITISRGSFSGGKMIAENLCRTLGYRCIDREVIVERAAARGVSQDELVAALDRPPTFIERLKHRKYLYLVLIQAALVEEVRTGRVVYHGHAGHFLLRAGPAILRVRIIAPLEFRVKMARERLRLSRQEALDHIARADAERRKWTQYLYGTDWGNPDNYDMVVNLEYMDIDEACESIGAAARLRCFEFTPCCQAAMDDLALASQVRTELALDPATSHLEFAVEAGAGAVQIAGQIPSGMADVVQRIAESVPGVSSVELQALSLEVRV